MIGETCREPFWFIIYTSSARLCASSCPPAAAERRRAELEAARREKSVLPERRVVRILDDAAVGAWPGREVQCEIGGEQFKQLVQTWIEILTNACKQNPFFEGHEGRSRSATLNSLQTPPRDTSRLTPPSNSQKSLKDPYIRLTECYSGNKIPPKAPPRPAKSSLDLRNKFSSESENDVGNNIQYLDLQFPSLLIQDEKLESESNNENNENYKENDEVIYRNIDFVKTKAFNEMRKEVETCRYNQVGEK